MANIELGMLLFVGVVCIANNSPVSSNQYLVVTHACVLRLLGLQNGSLIYGLLYHEI